MKGNGEEVEFEEQPSNGVRWKEDRDGVDHIKANYKLALGKPIKIDIREIDAEQSLHNGARVGQPIMQEWVECMVGGACRGDIFPALIVHEVPGAKKLTYVNVSGNHRLKMAKDLGEEFVNSEMRMGSTHRNPGYIERRGVRGAHEYRMARKPKWA